MSADLSDKSVAELRRAAEAWRAATAPWCNKSVHDRIDDLISEIARLRDLIATHPRS